ncbi:MAG: DUF711 domain-containing protein [Anaerolineae bacterium]|nr:MAG: DUF711 domain-containing protein [Anaerolineae bacterium]
MKIRSITYFMNVGWPMKEDRIQSAGIFLSTARKAFEEAGYEIQTTRLASVPFTRLLGADSIGLTPRFAQRLSKAIAENGIDYASLGPALPDVPESYEMIPDAIAASKNIFFSGVMADAEHGVYLPAVRSCAEVIVRNATLSPDGFANLRFAALANIVPGGPFFPAAYYDAETPAFALALEAADLAVSAFENARSIEEGRQALIKEIENHGRKLAYAAEPLKFRFNARFGGIDFSYAPYPNQATSLGAAFEKLGAPKVGLHGSLAAASILTDALDRADFPRLGFSGLMMPVLEDATLAARAAEGILGVKDLLMYAAVCGAGLDTVPLPGDVTVEQISALLLDLAVLALRLHKPLTARLMPVPGKKAGENTAFHFEYFANSRVMALQAEPLGRLFASNETFTVKPRQK